MTDITKLEKLLKEIIKDTPAESIEEFKEMKEYSAGATVHHSGGMSMRNNLGFWQEDSEWHKWFKERGIWHADDMSGIVFDSFHRKLNDKPIDFEGQVKYYQEYWEKNVSSDQLKVISTKSGRASCATPNLSSNSKSSEEVSKYYKFKNTNEIAIETKESKCVIEGGERKTLSDIAPGLIHLKIINEKYGDGMEASFSRNDIEELNVDQCKKVEDLLGQLKNNRYEYRRNKKLIYSKFKKI